MEFFTGMVINLLREPYTRFLAVMGKLYPGRNGAFDDVCFDNFNNEI